MRYTARWQLLDWILGGEQINYFCFRNIENGFFDWLSKAHKHMGGVALIAGAEHGGGIFRS